MTVADKQVIRGIHGVMTDVGSIGKDREVTFGEKFKYRGIDDVLGALQPLFIKHQIICLPTVLNIDREERSTNAGKPVTRTTLTVQYRFISTIDGSELEIIAMGEGLDNSDKGIGKAASTAFKTMAFQLFVIPTDEARDVEAGDAPPINPPRAAQTAAAAKVKKEIADPNVTSAQLKEIGLWITTRLATLGLNADPMIRKQCGIESLAACDFQGDVTRFRASRVQYLKQAIAAWTPKEGAPGFDADVPAPGEG